MSELYPFTAIVGQEKVKKALILNLVNPKIGGVLISGEKGTAKSTLVRGLSQLTTEMKIVELPLNTTEDRLVGTVDFEKAVHFGIKIFEPGILKSADKNILYIDEVNLLSDHIVKSILEAAGSGMNIVEREGISYKHEANFILIGSMNPEEGKLRPQFLDRFGLYVEITGENDVWKRAEIIKRRITFEADPEAFARRFLDTQRELSERIQLARECLHKILVSENALKLAVSIAKDAKTAGHRAELVIIQTARAIAALDGRTTLNTGDIQEAAQYALPHRIRQYIQEENHTMENKGNTESNPEECELENMQMPEDNSEQAHKDEDKGDVPLDIEHSDEVEQPIKQDKPKEQIELPGDMFQINQWLSQDYKASVLYGSGRRSLVKTDSLQGRYVKYRYPVKKDRFDIALDATLRAAAPYQHQREKNNMAICIRREDFRMKVREKRIGNTIVFVVDASGSMGAKQRMTAVKGAILSLLNDAYQKRDKVALIIFRNQEAEILLPVTRSVDLAQKLLASLPTGGRTPLSEGLYKARLFIEAEKLKDKDMLPVLVLVSDGRATWCAGGENPFDAAVAEAGKIAVSRIHSIVMDTEQDFIRLGMAEKIAEAMNADIFTIENLIAEGIAGAVSRAVE